MQTIELKPGEQVLIIAAESRRGPKSLPPSTVSASQLHQPILDLLTTGEKTAMEIQEDIQNRFSGATTNTVAWALVELQNSNLKRSKKPDFQGPVVKTETGYTLRS